MNILVEEFFKLPIMLTLSGTNVLSILLSNNNFRKGASVIRMSTYSYDYNFIRSSRRIMVFYKTFFVILSAHNERRIPENDLVTSFNTGELHFCFRYSNSAFSVVLSIYNTM